MSPCLLRIAHLPPDESDQFEGFEMPAMLPPPSLSFTIPSVHDDTILHCRVYHPACLAPTSVSQIAQWNKKAAIVAHPYAPLGGSYDDPVVDVIASTILKQGFIVGTFNFRGAGGSKGRTSWQSKPEQKDYISFIGFMIYYLHHISSPNLPADFPKFTRTDPELHDLSPVPSQSLPAPHSPHLKFAETLAPTLPAITVQKERMDTQPHLLLAGYSYGALITTCLPPIISSIIAPFQKPLVGTAYAEIRLRADCLAAQQNDSIRTQISFLLHQSQSHRRGRSLHVDDRLPSPKIRRTSGGVRMGGEEDLRRASHDSYRSRSSFTIETPERVRKSVDRVRSMAKTGRYSPRRQNSHGSVLSYKSSKKASESSIEQNLPGDESPKKVVYEPPCKEIPGIVDGLQTAYLLVSPLQGIVNSLATMWSSKSIGPQAVENDMKLTIDPTLALFGDDDVFVSVKRLRVWAEKLMGAEKGDSQFRHREVAGAGHFWHHHEAIKILREEVKAFVQNL